MDVKDLKVFSYSLDIDNAISWECINYEVTVDSKDVVNGEPDKFVEWKFFPISELPSLEEIASYDQVLARQLR